MDLQPAFVCELEYAVTRARDDAAVSVWVADRGGRPLGLWNLYKDLANPTRLGSDFGVSLLGYLVFVLSFTLYQGLCPHQFLISYFLLILSNLASVPADHNGLY